MLTLESESRFLSLHIEKTGGVSLRKFFIDLYGPREVYFFNPNTGFTSAESFPGLARMTPWGERIRYGLLENPLTRRLYPPLRRFIKRLFQGHEIQPPRSEIGSL